MAGCGSSQELTREQKLAKLAADVLLQVDRAILLSPERVGKLARAETAAMEDVPKWKESCSGLAQAEVQLDLDRREDRLASPDKYQDAMLMADPNLASLLNANSMDDNRLDEATSKNSAAIEARKRRAQMEKDESNGELHKSRSTLRDALKKVTR